MAKKTLKDEVAEKIHTTERPSLKTKKTTKNARDTKPERKKKPALKEEVTNGISRLNGKTNGRLKSLPPDLPVEVKINDQVTTAVKSSETKTESAPKPKVKIPKPKIYARKEPLISDLPEATPSVSKAKTSRVSGEKKIFVIDTSVILYNHDSINNFEDNDVAIPITVLEELDNFKKGNDTKNFEAREFIRIIDSLSENGMLTDWIPLVKSKGGKFKVVMNEKSTVDARQIFDDNKPDHRILNAALALSQEYPERKVVLVSKDINLRLKAKSLNIAAEDFLTGKIKDVEGLYTGISTINNLSSKIIDKLYQQGYCMPKDIGVKNPIPNQYFILRNTTTSALAFYNSLSKKVERIEKRSAFRITPRNAEQVFALHAILNPDVKLVTLQGVAGTGKTLLALAAALDQKRNFKQVFLARPIVPLSNKDIGFLPGDIKSKINPYMEPLYDNLKFIQSQYSEKDKEYKNITDSLDNEKLVIQPLAYIRGRSISNVCFIVDEAQNLTPHEIKTIITRAGQGTKIIFTGDIYQIDTPYLDAQSNGLSYLIDKVKHHSIYAHVRLEKGERSELANLANDLL
ncbi:MAG: PhoH family protein [Bacteroidales bacterium]|nr:PhoH family protein [Bacteroidales bacterium]